MKIKLSRTQWEEMGKKAGWMDKGTHKNYPKPDLQPRSRKRNRDGSYEVTYPVSYTYNGGIIIGDKWYKGYRVPKPDVPKGWELVDIGVGLQLNARPPYATMLLRPKKS